MMLLFAAALLQTAPVSAPVSAGAPKERETVITYASNGALRDWRRGATPDILFVRDRNEQWYRITTTGPCPNLGSIDTLSYTTDTNGTFDRFSRLSFLRFPALKCGVKSIVATLPPKGMQGSRKPPRR